MIGRLGEINKFKERVKRDLDRLSLAPLGEDLSEETGKKLKEILADYWKIYQKKPYLWDYIWRVYSQLLPYDMEEIVALLRFFYREKQRLENEQRAKETGHLKDRRMEDILFNFVNVNLAMVTVWAFFRGSGLSRKKRLELLADDVFLLLEEQEYQGFEAVSLVPRAKESFQIIMESEDPARINNLEEELSLVMECYPGEDERLSLLMYLRQMCPDLPFLTQYFTKTQSA